MNRGKNAYKEGNNGQVPYHLSSFEPSNPLYYSHVQCCQLLLPRISGAHLQS